MKNKKKSSKVNYKPNPIAYFIYTLYSKLFCFFHGIKIDRKILNEQLKKKKQEKKGFIVIYNHHSNKDHWIFSASMNYHHTNFVLARYFLYNKTIAVLTGWVKAIFKEQFKPDLSSIRQMKRAVDRPGILAIAPAGQISVDGGDQFVSHGIVKLVRFCKVDVIGLVIKGTHYAYPKWRNKDRKYPCSASFCHVLTADELNDLTDEEIYERIYQVSSIDAIKIQQKDQFQIKANKRAEGLEKIIYLCPKCHEYHTYTAKNNELKCQKCGNTAIFNKYGLFEKKNNDDIIFKTENEWTKYQIKTIKEEIKNNDDFHLENRFELYRDLRIENKLEKVGEGTLYLTKNRLYYKGTLNNQPYEKEFSLGSIFQLPFSPAKHFYVPNDEGPFKFKPLDDKSTVMRFVETIDAMREIAEEEGKVY